MQQTSNPVSSKKKALVWLWLVCFFISMVIFWSWFYRGSIPASETGSTPARIIGSIFIGWLLFVAGLLSYFAVIFSTCFTFSFDRPVWKSHKTKVFVANIFVPLLPALGIGIAIQPFFAPTLTRLGLDAAIANLLPVMLMIGVLQFLQLKVLIWAPLEKRFITKRLSAQGLTDAQLQAGMLTGISDPLRTSLAKGIIEDDMGVLFFNQNELLFWGDGEQISITRDQLLRLERKGDALNTTALSGITHIILHVRKPDGTERQIRLHMEGLFTMDQKRRAMDQAADRIAKWHANVPIAMGLPS